jgi:septin family protein
MPTKGVTEIIPNKKQWQIAMNRLVPEARKILAQEAKEKKGNPKGA